MKIFALLSALVVVAAILSGGATANSSTQAATYPKAVVTAFDKSCVAVAKSSAGKSVTAAAIVSYCGCSVAYLEKHLTYHEFVTESKAVLTLSAGTAKAKAAYKGAALACKGRLIVTKA